jgi:hypothetical protein
VESSDLRAELDITDGLAFEEPAQRERGGTEAHEEATPEGFLVGATDEEADAIGNALSRIVRGR